jgi:hypothetical protein
MRIRRCPSRMQGNGGKRGQPTSATTDSTAAPPKADSGSKNPTLKPKPLIFLRAEFTKIATATGMGFLVMGFIGFFVKLMFIPINNIIVSFGHGA